MTDHYFSDNNLIHIHNLAIFIYNAEFRIKMFCFGHIKDLFITIKMRYSF